MNYYLGGILVLGSALAGIQVLGPMILPYSLDEGSVRLLLFGKWPIWELKASEVVDIRRANARDLLWSKKATNRVFGSYVAIKTSSGMVRTILVTPGNAEEFVARSKRMLLSGAAGASGATSD